jgi:zinc/manganese transport system substrate-binding protein
VRKLSRWPLTARRAVVPPVLAAALLTTALTGCASSPTRLAPDGRVAVVASTNVWGDVAAEVGGSHVDVTPIISDPAQDPHGYQATVQNRLAVSRAAVVISNGGGYDDFMTTLLNTVPTGSVRAVDAVEVSGYAGTQGVELNEHVWYDLPTVAKVAAAIASELAQVQPAHAAAFHANANRFRAALNSLIRTEAMLRATHAGQGAAITESVPLYLLQACGLINRTPAAFSAAVESESDVAPRVLQQTEALLSGHQVVLLAYNEQTSSSTTQKVLDLARANQIPVVPVTETLPGGATYLTWMSATLRSVRTALA